MGVSQQEIADHLGLARSTITKILNQFPNNRASKDTVKQVFKAAREMGYDFGRLRNIHRRRANRKKVDLPILFRIDLEDGKGVYDTGSALIRDLSPYGAQVTSLQTRTNTLPLLPFSIHLEFFGPLQGISIPAKIIRFSSDGPVLLGLSFNNVSSETERRIIEFLE